MSNIAENIDGREDERSIDSEDLARSDISGLIVNEEDDIGLSESEARGAECLATTDFGGDVSIFSNSEHLRGGQNNPREKEEEAEELGIELRRERRAKRISPERMGDATPWEGQDGRQAGMPDYQRGNAPTLYSDPTVTQSAEGQLRVSGLTGQTREPQGPSFTQRLPAMRDQVPTDRSDLESRRAGQLGPPPPKPRPPVPAEEEGVDLLWEKESSIEEEGEEDSGTEDHRDDWEKNRREEMELESEWRVLLERVLSLFNQKQELLRKGPAPWVADARGEILSTGMSAMGAIVLPEEDKYLMGLSEMDLAVRLVREREEDVARVKESLLVERVDMGKIGSLMSQASELIENNYQLLEESVNKDALLNMVERHQALCQGLVGVPKIAKRMARIFPPGEVKKIVEWYSRFVQGLKQLGRLQGVLDSAKGEMGRLLDGYPGPALPEGWHGREESSAAVGKAMPMRPLGGLRTLMESAREGPGEKQGPGYLSPRTQRGTTPGVNLSPLAEPLMGKPEERELGYGLRSTGSSQGSRGRGIQDEAWIRQEAAAAGRGFRMGGAPSAEHGTGVRDRRGGAPAKVFDIPKSDIRSKLPSSGPAEYGREADNASVGRSQGQGSRMGTGTDCTEYFEGFEDMTLEEIKAEVKVYIAEQLESNGRGSAMTEKILMDNFPPLGIVSKTSQRSAQIRDINRQVKEIKPQSDGGSFIAISDWWKAINSVGDSFSWSFEVRCLFLKLTGGLAAGVNDIIRDRVMVLMTETEAWLPDYQPGHRETDVRHWLYVWMDVGIKLILEFHQVQPQGMIKKGLTELMAMPKYKIDQRCDDPLNRDFHKVDELYRAGNVYLRKRSADLVGTPIYWWQIMIDGLKLQAPAGPLMINHIDQSLAKLSVNPGSVLPTNHGLSCSELDEVRRRGGTGATEKTFEQILGALKNKALNGQLTMEFKTFSQVEAMMKKGGFSGGGGQGQSHNQGQWQTQGRGGRNRATNSTHSDSSPSTLTMYTGASSRRTPPCVVCRLFHETSTQGKCPFVKDGKLQAKAFLKHRNVRAIDAQGKSSLSRYWTKKLEQYVFPALKITDTARKQRIVNELHEMATKWPIASPAEIEKFAQDSKRYLAMTTMEDSHSINYLRTEVNAIVNAVGKLGKGPTAKSSSRTSSRRPRSYEALEESDSDDEYDSDDLSLN